MTQPTIPPPKSSRPDPRPPRGRAEEDDTPSGASFHDLLAEEKEGGGLTPQEQTATSEEQPEDPEEPQGSDDGEAGGDERADDPAADESDEPEQIDEDDPSEAIEEPEELPAEDDKGPVEDQGEVAELRRELNELRQQHAETLAFLRQQVSPQQPEPTSAPENPEVEEAFELYADPTLSQKERDEALKAYSPVVRRKAEAKVREAIEERRLLDRDPERWVDKRVGPRLRELEQKLETTTRALAVEAFKARNADLYASPEAKARLLAVMEQGARTGKVDPDQAALMVRQELQVAKAKKASTKVEARARDARARKAAARQQAGRRAEPRSGGEARGGATGNERTFRELLRNEEGRVV